MGSNSVWECRTKQITDIWSKSVQEDVQQNIERCPSLMGVTTLKRCSQRRYVTASPHSVEGGLGHKQY